MKNALSQILLRLPRELHREVKSAALAQGLSLNQYCLYLLARYSSRTEEIQKKKGEDLLHFLEEASVLQRELNPKKLKLKSLPVQETPIGRFRKLYAKN